MFTLLAILDTMIGSLGRLVITVDLFHLSLIPIGAYEPREFLKCQHVNPEEAVKVHDEVKSKFSLGIHWGTLRQGKEHYLAPPKDLKAALDAANIDEAKFVTFQHGECREI